MAKNKVILEDNLGNEVIPVTDTDSVFMMDYSTKLTDKLKNFDSSLESNVQQIDNIDLNKANTKDVYLKTVIDSFLNQKSDKTHVWTMANMGQDVKTAMTGGSVAVIGENAVLKDNIVTRQVTIDKLNDNVFNPNIINMYANQRSTSASSFLELILPISLFTSSNKIKFTLYTDDITDVITCNVWKNATGVIGGVSGKISNFTMPTMSSDGKYYTTNTIAFDSTALASPYISLLFSNTMVSNPSNLIVKKNLYIRDITVNGVEINLSTAYKYGIYTTMADSANKITLIDCDSRTLAKKEELNILKDTIGVLSNKYKDKILGCMGDSITYGTGASDRLTTSYPPLVKNTLGFGSLLNYGMSGTLIAKETGFSNSFAERYASMSDNIDVLTVFGGTNDWYFGTKFGTKESEDITEFYGALNVLIKGLLTKYVGKEIIFITPMSSQYGGKMTDNPNKAGKTMLDYRNAIIERCAYYGIPCLDLYSMSGMDVAHNSAHLSYYSSDGVHPNDNGYRRVADRVVGILRQI